MEPVLDVLIAKMFIHLKNWPLPETTKGGPILSYGCARGDALRAQERAIPIPAKGCRRLKFM
jgi:hypothetical protein